MTWSSLRFASTRNRCGKLQVDEDFFDGGDLMEEIWRKAMTIPHIPLPYPLCATFHATVCRTSGFFGEGNIGMMFRWALLQSGTALKQCGSCGEDPKTTQIQVIDSEGGGSWFAYQLSAANQGGFPPICTHTVQMLVPCLGRLNADATRCWWMRALVSTLTPWMAKPVNFGTKEPRLTAARDEVEPDTYGLSTFLPFCMPHNFHQFLLFKFDRREASPMKAFEINITQPCGVSNWVLAT